MKLYFFVSSLLILFFSCTNTEDKIITNEININGNVYSASRPNILLLIADDLGIEATPGFLNQYPSLLKANMSVLDSLRQHGISFVNHWSTPVCSPTRATLLTGKYGYHTGVFDAGDHISTSELSLQQLMKENNAGYATAIFGKWHLTSDYSDPQLMGIDHFAGIAGGAVNNYYDWELLYNGDSTEDITEYITSKLTDLAIDWISEQNKPWFVWMGYNAPHTPFHDPPSDLHTVSDLSTEIGQFFAAAEALDTEMGRLIRSIPQEELDNTIILYVGDNGSPSGVSQIFTNAKGTIWQGGINTPVVVSGAGVSRIGETDSSLINSTDFFATIADLAGTGIDTLNNSVSFKSLLTNEGSSRRTYVYAEKPGTNNKTGYTIRNSSLKYMYTGTSNSRVYNLLNDPLEQNGIKGQLNDDQIQDTLELYNILHNIIRQ